MKKLITISCACAALFFASCSGGNSNNENTDANTEATSEMLEDEEAEEPEEDNATAIPGLDDLQVDNNIAITGNDQMKYDKTLFKVKAGETVTLTLKNVGELPATEMSHDVVVLQLDADVITFGNAVAQAQDRSIENLSPDEKGLIIASTKMLGPGESDKITFTLPEAGVYPFLCTFPGHYMSMQGKIVAVAE